MGEGKSLGKEQSRKKEQLQTTQGKNQSDKLEICKKEEQGVRICHYRMFCQGMP